MSRALGIAAVVPGAGPVAVGQRPTSYLGEKARIAVALINRSFDGPDIRPDGDGYWRVPRTPTQWDAAIAAPKWLRRTDGQMIEQALMWAGDGMLVGGPALDDLRAAHDYRDRGAQA